jgi:hypothetical protein
VDRIQIDGSPVTRADIEGMRTLVIGWRDESFKQWPEAIPFTVQATTLVEFLYGVIEQYPEDGE